MSFTSPPVQADKASVTREASCVESASMPRQYRETGDEKGNEAEQKPFPRDLARLHPVPTTRSRRWPINLDLACFSIARKTPSF